MSAIRRHLRVCVAIWSLGQAAMLTALLPRDCCAAHPSDRHVMTPPASPAAMDREHCPMGDHEGGVRGPRTDAAERNGTPAPRPCTLRAVCNGPLAALASLLSAQGMPPDAIGIGVDLQAALPPPVPTDPVLEPHSTPAAPPPRA